MTGVAIIGGTGLKALNGLEVIQEQQVQTPYGAPSGPLVRGRLCAKEICFLARHGPEHTIPPHRVNYRANTWALRESGVDKVIAVAAVGGISAQMTPARIVFPDQIIDYTAGREHTFFDDADAPVTHIDFTAPYSQDLRTLLIQAAKAIGLDSYSGGTYGATQGPRLETAAEIDRMERDGCTLVGMTGMPEAPLARELGLSYACCAVVANWAAGRGEGEISMEEIQTNVSTGMQAVKRLLEAVIPMI